MPEPITRTALLRAAAATALACAVPLRVRAADALRVGSLTSDVSAEPHYAAAEGFFTKGGFDAQIQTLANGGAIIAAVASRALDVGFGNLTSIAAARQRGVPIRIVAPATVYTDKSPVTVLVKAKGSKLHTGADLKGKTIAVSTLKGELQVGASMWIDKNGGDSSDVKFIEMPFSVMASALTGGRVDAAMMTEPAITLHRDSVELLSDAYSAIAPQFLIGAWVASESWLHDNPAPARRLAAVMAETAHWANTHRAESGAILAKHAGLDDALVRAMTRATYGEHLTPELIQPVLDAANHYGSLKTPMKAADLVAV